MLKIALRFLMVSMLCALFGAVYERFSHEVYSYAMLYAFAFPLTGGTLVYMGLALSRRSRTPSSAARQLYNAGVATLTAGSILKGVLDIYGTSSSLAGIYWYFGAGLCAAGALVYAAATRQPQGAYNVK